MSSWVGIGYAKSRSQPNYGGGSRSGTILKHNNIGNNNNIYNILYIKAYIFKNPLIETYKVGTNAPPNSNWHVVLFSNSLFTLYLSVTLFIIYAENYMNYRLYRTTYVHSIIKYK